MASGRERALDESPLPEEERERLAQALALDDFEPGHVVKQGLHVRRLLPHRIFQPYLVKL